MIKAPKKLIEVALPLEDINIASAREKSIRHGHPSTLHLWWARRPLAAARAVLFAQLVNDPGGERGWGNYPGQTKEDAQKERERLFAIIRELVKGENTNRKKASPIFPVFWNDSPALLMMPDQIEEQNQNRLPCQVGRTNQARSEQSKK
jgi:adenine-specific DNA methylase